MLSGLVSPTGAKARGLSLDEVLEGVSIRPLLGERRSVSHCGEVTQSQPVLHAFVPACHLLLFRLRREQRNTDIKPALSIPPS